MGMKIPSVVPFGTRVQVLTRSWLRRHKQAWSLKATSATVLCPASLVKLGYVVRIGKRLSVVTKLFEGEDPPVRAVLNQGDAEPPLAHSIGPETRITGKQPRPGHVDCPGPKKPR